MIFGAGFSRVAPQLAFHPAASLAYLLLGRRGRCRRHLAACCARCGCGGPARALRGEGERAGLPRGDGRGRLAAAMLVFAVLARLVPPLGSIPVGGYAAVVFVLAAAILASWCSRTPLLPLLARGRSATWRLAHARLAAAPGQAVVAGGVIASVARGPMAIMVNSFRVSVDEWLAQVLPADLCVRASVASGSGYLDPPALTRIAATQGVARVDTTRLINLRLSDAEPLFTVLARPAQGNWGLPLVKRIDGAGGGRCRGLPPAWVSEAAADRHDLARKPLRAAAWGRVQAFRVAGCGATTPASTAPR